ncbi:hypothetical protein [Paenibacillus sp. EPM92]|uniref:hypothetical protein n=1 Tax=Paenibacillus sp. EPM92 TaxID=1561195 RepID=UPI001915DAC2|nr:hypothetical protein [Paenibacillus sp. EPM92]
MLPKDDALAVLRHNLSQLEQQKQLWELGKRIKGEHGLSSFVEASFDNAIELMEADIRYITRLIALLQL